jgi:hypothetical protein
MFPTAIESHSGLVQVSLNAAGTGCPRDSDMQRVCLGRALDPAESKKLQRGDLTDDELMMKTDHDED